MDLENKYDKHVFVCINSRVDLDRDSCGDVGLSLRQEVIKKLNTKDKKGLNIRINKSGCLNKCELGPTIVIYPEGFWYYRVTIKDIDEIIDQSILNNNYIERLSSKKQ